MLSKLASVPSFNDPAWVAAAEYFVNTYGPLRPYPGDRIREEQEVAEFARRFREAWTAAAEKDMQKIRSVNRALEEIFEAGDAVAGIRPALRANFLTGKWEPSPRNLLDDLAIELMRSRKMLHQCERPECRKYFVKTHSRNRYCSYLCGEDMRGRSQEKWVDEHRDEIKRRRKRRKK